MTEDITTHLDTLSLEDLRTVEAKVQELITQRQKAELDKAKAEIKKLAEKYGLDVEIRKVDQSAKPKRATPKPKYRHPSDPEITWSGRGRKPGWLQEAMNGGASLADFLISEE